MSFSPSCYNCQLYLVRGTGSTFFVYLFPRFGAGTGTQGLAHTKYALCHWATPPTPHSFCNPRINDHFSNIKYMFLKVFLICSEVILEVLFLLHLPFESESIYLAFALCTVIQLANNVTIIIVTFFECLVCVRCYTKHFISIIFLILRNSLWDDNYYFYFRKKWRDVDSQYANIHLTVKEVKAGFELSTDSTAHSFP